MRDDSCVVKQVAWKPQACALHTPAVLTFVLHPALGRAWAAPRSRRGAGPVAVATSAGQGAGAEGAATQGTLPFEYTELRAPALAWLYVCTLTPRAHSRAHGMLRL